MDRERSRRYLRAMGVQVWLRRENASGAEGHEEPGATPRCESLADGAPVAAVEGPEHYRAGGEPITPDSASLTQIDRMEWEELRRTVAGCRACELHRTRTQTVFGVGNLYADLMIIGEAPGADEDRQGEPFVGRAGQLLNLMLGAIGLAREQVYIANVLKCRPPGNRDPRPQEALCCKPYLMRQIGLVQPKVLLSVGRISAQRLLETDSAIGRLRGRWFEFGPERRPLMVTYHPAYLLRSPEQKSKVWLDLVQVAHRLRAGGQGAAEVRGK